MRLRMLILALALVPASVIPAFGATELPENCRNLETNPELPARVVCTERVYFECRSAHKFANLDNVNSPTTWSKTAPSQSVQDGAGCGSLDTALTGESDHNPLYDTPFAGTYEGRIESLTLHGHVIDAGLARADDDFRFEAHVLIDGVQHVARGNDISVTPVESETGLSREIVVSVTDVGLIGLADDGEHDIQVTLYAPYIDTNQNAWVWGTTEVPSGIEFNSTTVAPARYRSEA